MWPDVAVCIPTFNRAPIVRRTVELLLSNLHYSGRILIFVGCDGADSTPAQIFAIRPIDDRTIVVMGNPAGGIGANMNRLIRQAQAQGIDYYIGLDDDHHLIAPLCLDRHVQKLMTDLSAGWIHLLMEAKGDEHFDRYQFTASLDRDHYWRIHWDCAERFVMSFRPHLAHRRWFEAMGYLAEGLRTGETEWEYSGRTKARGMAGAGVNAFVPLVAHDAGTWHHANGGVSWNQMGL
jgi:glycosyltransferase involved in cell wall biosynthesis